MNNIEDIEIKAEDMYTDAFIDFMGEFTEPPDPLLWELEMYYEEQCERFHMLGSLIDDDHEMFRHRLKELEVRMNLGHHGDMSDPAYRDYFEKRNALLREWTCSSERAEVLEKIEQLKNGECYE